SGAREYNTGVPHPAALAEWECNETYHQAPHQNTLLMGTLMLSSKIVKSCGVVAPLLLTCCGRSRLTPWHRASLFGAGLRSSTLEGADFTGADLFHVSLTGANLIHANRTGANLTGANLTGTKGLSQNS